jgi:hypothetical protein
VISLFKATPIVDAAEPSPLSNPDQPTAVLEKAMQPPTTSAESRRAVPAATSMLVFALVLALLMFAFWT